MFLFTISPFIILLLSNPLWIYYSILYLFVEHFTGPGPGYEVLSNNMMARLFAGYFVLIINTFTGAYIGYLITVIWLTKAGIWYTCGSNPCPGWEHVPIAVAIGFVASLFWTGMLIMGRNTKGVGGFGSSAFIAFMISGFIMFELGDMPSPDLPGRAALGAALLAGIAGGSTVWLGAWLLPKLDKRSLKRQSDEQVAKYAIRLLDLALKEFIERKLIDSSLYFIDRAVEAIMVKGLRGKIDRLAVEYKNDVPKQSPGCIRYVRETEERSYKIKNKYDAVICGERSGIAFWICKGETLIIVKGAIVGEEQPTHWYVEIYENAISEKSKQIEESYSHNELVSKIAYGIYHIWLKVRQREDRYCYLDSGVRPIVEAFEEASRFGGLAGIWNIPGVLFDATLWIIYLHGDPSRPESHCNAKFTFYSDIYETTEEVEATALVDKSNYRDNLHVWIRTTWSIITARCEIRTSTKLGMFCIVRVYEH